MTQPETVMVTGGGSGIGRAVAQRLAENGTAVLVADIDAGAATSTVENIAKDGGSALARVVDVTNRASIRTAADDAVAEYGQIDGLVNCAGLITMASLDELTEEDWDLVVDVNLKGTWLTTQEVSKDIARAGGGSVVNISSVEAEVVVSSKGFCQVHYNASKGGVKSLTKALAVELSRSAIRVNAVAPGPIATDFVSLEEITSTKTLSALKERLLIPRVGLPEDVAAAVTFLMSAEASWITGIQLPVDGGWLTR